MRHKQIPRSFHEDEELTAYSLCDVSIMQRDSYQEAKLARRRQNESCHIYWCKYGTEGTRGWYVYGTTLIDSSSLLNVKRLPAFVL